MLLYRGHFITKVLVLGQADDCVVWLVRRWDGKGDVKERKSKEGTYPWKNRILLGRASTSMMFLEACKIWAGYINPQKNHKRYHQHLCILILLFPRSTKDDKGKERKRKTRKLRRKEYTPNEGYIPTEKDQTHS